MAKLGVNIDHVATIRQARRTVEPDPVHAAFVAEQAGADGITVHLRADRRHINDRDVKMLLQTVRTKLNLEMSLNEEIVRLACRWKPQHCCIVPENRQEVTTEGGLDVVNQQARVKKAVGKLMHKGVIVSLFIDPIEDQVKAAANAGAAFIELHTGEYAGAGKENRRQRELDKLVNAAEIAWKLGLRVNAGHGLTYHNVQLVAKIPGVEELNIGHSIISRAVISGLSEAVSEMKRLIVEASRPWE